MDALITYKPSVNVVRVGLKSEGLHVLHHAIH